jgi:hypothetical protein
MRPAGQDFAALIAHGPVMVPLYSIRNAGPFWSFFLRFSGPPEQ